MISPFVLTLVLSAVSGEPGLWMPTTGRAGERPLNALGAGGDGAIYATGGGAVYRLEPGADWRRIGRTAPRLRWDSDGEVEARGAFPPAVLAAVEAEASALLDFATVEGDEAQVAPERIAEALRDYVEEASENPASAHGVAAITAAPAGVWLATGSGLYFADRSGVLGPVGQLEGPVRAVLPQADILWVATQNGVYRTQNGLPATRVRTGRITGFAQGEGQVAMIADGVLHVGNSVEGASPLKMPSGDPLQLTGDARGLYVSTRMAVHRRSAGQWRLCAGISGEARRLVLDGSNLLAVTDDAVWVFADDCQRVSRIGPPWPGGFQFTGVAGLGGLVWAASNEGAFLLGPMDADTSLAVQMEGYERAVRAIPSIDVLVVRALEAHGLDAASRDFGSRPLARTLLPDVVADVRSQWSRRERNDLNTQLVDIDIVNPRFAWQVWLTWTVPLDRIGVLASAERDAALEAMRAEQATDEVDGETVVDLVDAETLDLVLDDDEAGLVMLEADGEADLEDRISEDISRERRATARERRKLVSQVQRLYQQRQNLLYRLWVLRSKDLQQRALLVLSVDELEERLSALTGGAFRVAARTPIESNAEKESMP